MNCEICKQSVNLNTKQPLIMPCCGETICKECKLKLVAYPQENVFQCPLCQAMNKYDAKFLENKNMQKQLLNSVGIYCDKHPEKIAEFFCKNEFQLICINCAVTNHSTHNIVQVNKSEIEIQHKIIQKRLQEEQQRIATIQSQISAFDKNQKPFTSTEYIKIIMEIKDMFGKSLVKDKNEIKQLQDMKGCIIIQSNNLDSTIVTKQQDVDFIFESIKVERPQSKLLFRGSKDGFTAQDFHRLCDNKGPTLTVIKSEHNQIFGGYTSISWTSDQNASYKVDKNAFIFQLNKRSIHAVAYAGPCFGAGDIAILINNGGFNSNNSSNFPITFKAPVGSQYFQISEIEVFQVIQSL